MRVNGFNPSLILKNWKVIFSMREKYLELKHFFISKIFVRPHSLKNARVAQNLCFVMIFLTSLNWIPWVFLISCRVENVGIARTSLSHVLRPLIVQGLSSLSARHSFKTLRQKRKRERLSFLFTLKIIIFHWIVLLTKHFMLFRILLVLMGEWVEVSRAN